MKAVRNPFVLVAALVAFAGIVFFFQPAAHFDPATVAQTINPFDIGFAIAGATLASNVLTLADWAKRLDPNGQVPTIVELLSQTNDILRDMLWKEGNLPTGERTTVRTGLPTVAWRLLNQGVATSKSTTAQVDENAGMLEAWCEVDKDLCELNGNTEQFRLSEAQAFIEAMNQNMAATLIYGNSATNPEQFLGFAPRYSTISGAVNAQNIIDAGGTGSDNASVWLVGWGANTVFGVFPKASKAGLVHENLGLVTAETTAGVGGTRMRVYQDHWQWKCGLVVKDWRYAVRIANIDISDLVGSSGTQNAQQLIKLLSRAIDRIPSYGMCRPVFYANRTVMSLLRIQALDKSQNALSVEQALDQFGNPVKGGLSFLGIPVRIVDQLLDNTEARVV